jgi:cell division protein FtsQ
MRQLSVQSNSTKKRKRTTAIWKRPSFKPLLSSAALGLIAALLTYAVKTGFADLTAKRTTESMIKISASAGFIIKDVLVEGREHTPKSDLRAVVDLQLNQPILDISPEHLRERIEALPWVATASVTRQLPDIIHIRLNEHRPIAMWQNGGTFSLINKVGEVILTGGEDIKAFSYLPLVVGTGAPVHTDHLLKILASEPDLQKRVTAAVRVSDRRWDIKLDNGASIRLPEENPEQAWARLAIYEKDYPLLEKKLTSIDLRLPDRILIKIDENETIRKPILGQDT